MFVQSVSVYGIYFDTQGRVLLVKDAHSGLWGFPGGGVENGEAHEDALHREFLEETGLRISGDITYVTLQNDPTKRRYFYKVQKTGGRVNGSGNGDDIVNAAHFAVSQLPLNEMASGLGRIIQQDQ